MKKNPAVQKKRWTWKAESDPSAWLYLLPALLCLLAFNIYPLLRTFWISLQEGNILESHFTGFTNFLVVLQDPEFHLAIKNTAIFAITVVPVSLVLSLLIAIIIHSKIRGSKIYETIFFVPYLTSIIAVGVVFRYLFNGNYGLINYLLHFVGLGPYNFLDNPDYNMLTLILFGIWSSLAFNIIIFLSGLRNIDTSYYKVADMFGASSWESFRFITLPSLIPILTFLSITSFISAFKVYGQVFSLFNGKAGIGNRAVTAVFYIYNKFYVENRYGQGMAAAVILFFIILLFTLIQRTILKRIAQ